MDKNISTYEQTNENEQENVFNKCHPDFIFKNQVASWTGTGTNHKIIKSLVTLVEF